MGLDDGEMLLGGRYRIQEPLGRGGMGVVYRAWDERLGVAVAVKEMSLQPGIPPEWAEQLYDQFSQEARVLAGLDHPHLVHVTDFFTDDGTEYLVMNFVEGENLRERIARLGPLAEAQVLIWAGQLLDALAYCHRFEVYHRDVKPQNVIIRPDGRAVLVDFGLVKQVQADQMQTITAVRGMGTPGYASPEQTDPAAHTDARSDIYSLGATLYHALTGSAPPTITQRTTHVKPLDPVRAVVPQVSRRTEQAVLKALEMGLSSRWQSAQEMAHALSVTGPVILTGKKRASRSTASGTTPRKARTRARPTGWMRWALIGLAVVLVVAAGATGTRMLRARGATPKPTLTQAAVPSATEGATQSTTTAPAQAATAAATATEPPRATATDTARPTGTPTPPPTHTRRPSPTPVRLTETPSATPSAVATPSAALAEIAVPPTDTPVTRWLPAPALIAPARGASFTGWGAQVVLQWTGLRGLGRDEYYVVRIPYNGSGDAAEFWRKETTLNVPPHFSTLDVGFDDRHYTWTVQAQRCTQNCAQAADDNVRKSGVAVGAQSQEGLFYWHSDIGGPKPTTRPTAER